MPNIKLSNFAEGAVDERFNLELKKALENLADLNTDPLKARKITLTITLKGNEERDIASVDVTGKVALVPANGISARIMIGSENGKLVANELKSGVPGQMFVDDNGDVLDDKGEPVPEEKSGNVVNFK